MHELSLKMKDIIRTEIMSELNDKKSILHQILKLGAAYNSLINVV